jgi:hypothetical protein
MDKKKKGELRAGDKFYNQKHIDIIWGVLSGIF